MSPPSEPPKDEEETEVQNTAKDSQATLLEYITQVTQEHICEHDVTMTYAQAMQAASRCQAMLEQEQEVYAFFMGILAGTSELTTISVDTDAKDYQGRPLVAKIPLDEIMQAEIPDAEARASALQPFFASISNYYARRVTRWVGELTTYMAIAAAQMPKT